MDEITDNNSSFVLSNYFSIKYLYLILGMMLILLSYFTLSIFLGIHFLVKVTFLIIFLILAAFCIREAFRTTNINVEDNRLLIGIKEIRASEVEEIVYNSWMIYIKCKNRRGFSKYVSIFLRDNKDLERLKSKLNEFGNSHNIKIRKIF